MFVKNGMNIRLPLGRVAAYAVRLFYLIMNNKRAILFTSAYALLSVYVMFHFLSSSLLGDRYYRTAYDAMYAGTAWKPFVYRVLIPQLTKTVVETTPSRWRKSVNQSVRNWMSDPDTLRTRHLLPWLVNIYNKPDPYPRIVTTAIIYVALWGYIIMLHQLAASLVPSDRALRWFAPIIGMLAISSFSRPWQYVYDIPVLFIASSCYFFLFNKYFKAYLFFFLLACLNRETAIFIFLFFTIWGYKRLSVQGFVSLWFIQCAVYTAVKVVLTFAYIENPGWFLENNLVRVLNHDLLSQDGLGKIISIVVAFFFFTYKWHDKPAFLKNALWILPVIYGAYIVHGNPGEYRVFFDLLPLLILLITHTLTQASRLSDASFFQDTQTIRIPDATVDSVTKAKAVD